MTVKNKSIKIRTATSSDVEKICDLNRSLMEHHVRLDQDFYDLKDNYTEIFKKYIKKELKNKQNHKNKGAQFKLYVATHEGKIIAYLAGGIKKNTPAYIEEKIGYLSDGYVEPHFRKLGIMKDLTKRFIRWLKSKKIKSIYLEAHHKNTQGLNAWKKLGFEEKVKKMVKKI